MYRTRILNVTGLELVSLLILLKRRDNFLYNSFHVVSHVPVWILFLVTCYSDRLIMSLFSQPGARIASREGKLFHKIECFRIISVLQNLQELRKKTGNGRRKLTLHHVRVTFANVESQ